MKTASLSLPSPLSLALSLRRCSEKDKSVNACAEDRDRGKTENAPKKHRHMKFLFSSKPAYTHLRNKRRQNIIAHDFEEHAICIRLTSS